MVTAHRSRLPRLVVALLLVLCGMPLAYAQPIAALRLVNSADFVDVSASPSGSRVAALTTNGVGQGLVVLEWHGAMLSPVLSSPADAHLSMISYRWLTDDYLFIQYEDLVDRRAVPVAIIGVPKRNVIFRGTFTTVVQAPWGDGQHVLLSVDCSRGTHASNRYRGSCLESMDMTNGRVAAVGGPLGLYPIDYLALSSSQIYAGGDDDASTHREYVLNVRTGQWDAAGDGTFTRLSATQNAEAPAASELKAAAAAGVHDGTLLFTQPGHHLVGVIGRAPGPAFIALDPKLDAVQTMMKTDFAGSSVTISGLDDSLTRGLVSISGPDQPRRNLFLTASGELTEIAQLSSQIDPARLGRTHFERNWLSGVPIAVTVPPPDMPIAGAVMDLIIAGRDEGEEPLHRYDPAVQAFAERGIVVVRELAPMPESFTDAASGAAWRQALLDQTSKVIEHVSGELAAGKPVCLYGQGTDADLALAATALPHVGCAVAFDALMDAQPEIEEHVGSINGRVGRGRFGPVRAVIGYVLRSAPEEVLRWEGPALFGTAAGQLTDASAWTDGLPPTLMLSYDMSDHLEADIALRSGNFRSRVQHAGKALVYYAPDPGRLTGSQYFAGMLDAAVGYLLSYYQESATPANSQ